MLTKLQYLRTPPVFADPEKNRIAGILHTVLLFTLVILALAAIASGVVDYINQQTLVVTWIAIVGILLLAGMLWLTRRGHVQAAGIGLVISILLVVTITILDSGGIQNFSASFYVVAIIVAGMVLGARGALATGAVSTIIVLAVAYGQSSGLLILPPPTITTPTVVYAAVFIITGLLMYQTAQIYSGTLRQVYRTYQELEALSNVLEERVTERTRDLALAVEVGREVSRIRDLDQLLAEATEQIRSRFDLYYVQIYLTASSNQELILRSGTGAVGQQLVQAGHRLPLTPTSINGTAAAEKRTVLVSDTGKSATFRPNALLPKTRSEVAVPLIAGNTVVGVLNLQGDRPGLLGEDDLPAFEAIAGQLATAIENADLIAQLTEAQSEIEAQTRRLVREGWHDYLDGIQRRQLVGYRYDGQTQQLEALAELEETASSTSSGQAVARQLTTPIVLGGEELGQIHLQLDKDEEGLAANRLLVEAVVRQVARQVAQHAENLRLAQTSEIARSQAEQRSQELAHINRIVTAVAGSLDLQQSLQIIADGLTESLNVDQAAIALLNEAGDGLQIVADHFDKERSYSAIGITLPLEGNELSIEVLTKRQSVCIEDAQNNPRTALIHEALRSRGIETLYLFPVVTGNKAIGTVGIDILEQGRLLSPEQLRLAETIIFQAATAIQNSQLFATVEARVQELAMLNEVARSVSYQLEPGQLLEAIFNQVRRVLPSDIFFVGLFDTERQTVAYPFLYEDGQLTEEGPQPINPHSNVYQILQTGEPILKMLTREERERILAEQPDLLIGDTNIHKVPASVLYVPLQRGQRVVGAMSIQSYKKDAYTESDLVLLSGIASHASVALENARLYAAAQQRARREQLVNEITRRIQTTQTVESALQTAVQELGQALQARHTQVEILANLAGTKQLNGQTQPAISAD